MGKQAIDDDCNQTGQMLAELLGWPQATFASKVELGGDGRPRGHARGRRRPRDRWRSTLPAVVTADLRLNEPRYASLPGIMKAQEEADGRAGAGDLGVDVAPRVKIMKLESRRSAPAGRKVGSVPEL